ncbi:hypothetical protein ABND66_03700 [Paenibacillus larvae]
MWQRVKLAVSLFLLLGLTTGCGLMVSPVDLLKAPSVSSDRKDLKEAVQFYLPVGAKLTVVPFENGDQQSSIMEMDMDHDGNKEAAAFYKLEKNSVQQLGILILKQKDGLWTKIDGIQDAGMDIDFVKFVDVKGDGTQQMFVGWSGGEKLNKEMYIYSLNNEKLNQISKLSYNSIAIGNLGEDSSPQLVVLNADADSGEATAAVYGFRGGAPVLLDKKIVAKGITSIEKTVIGQGLPKKNTMFIEYKFNNSFYNTEILYLENKKIQTVFSDMTGRGKHTCKDYRAFSEDVNGDGIIKIPIPEPSPFAKTASTNKYLNKWYQWEGKENLKLVFQNYSDSQIGYRFDFPDEWLDKIALDRLKNKDTEGFSVLYYVPGMEERIELVNFRYYKTEDWQQESEKLEDKGISYVIIGRNNGMVITASVPEKTPPLKGQSLQQYNKLKVTTKDLQEKIKLRQIK